MLHRRTRLLMLVLLVLLSISAVIVVGRAQKFENGTLPQIPKTWDDKAVADLEVPLADPRYSPVHGVKTRAVKGHPFGLDLTAADRRALIAFLRSL